LPDEIMQKISAENNLSETAFIYTREGRLHIRWFTPETEVDLCGHATLGSAHVMFHHEGFTGQILEFQSKSGALRVKNKGDILELDFPASQYEPCAEPEGLADALGCKPAEVYASADYMAVFENEQDVINMKPDFAALKKPVPQRRYCHGKRLIVRFCQQIFCSENRHRRRPRHRFRPLPSHTLLDREAEQKTAHRQTGFKARRTSFLYAGL